MATLIPDPTRPGQYTFADPNQVINQTTGQTAAQMNTTPTATAAPAPVLSPSQIDSYYATQSPLANPMTPQQYLTSLTSPTPTPTPTAPTAITPEAMTGTAAPLPVSSPTQTNPYPVATLAEPDFSMNPEQKQASDLTKSLETLNNSLVGKSAYQTQENTAFGVDAAQKTITDLAAQLTGLKNEAAAIPLQLQQGAADRGVTTPLLGAQENSRLRTNAIAALGVSTLLAAAQGQLANAQSLADKAVEQKYGPIEEQIKAGMANLQLIQDSPEYTLAEKKQAFQMQQYLQQQSDATAQQKADYTNVLKISVDAASNISSFKATPQYQTAAQALQAMSQATSPEQALQIAASVGLTTTTSTAAPKIIGSASTGYFTVNPDGSTTPLETGPGTGGTPPSILGGGVPSGFTTQDVKEGDQVLRTGTLNGTKIGNPMGSDGYIDPAVYVKLLDYWIQQGGTKAAFFSKYPVKTYINPANTWVWSQLGIPNPYAKSGSSTSSGGSTSDLFNSL